MHPDAGEDVIELDDGRRLGFARYGDRCGRPIVYFHGGLSSRLDIRFADELCRRLQVDLVAVDRPGIGLSGFRPSGTLRDWAVDVGRLADHVGLGRFAVLGWSGGGPHALACAAHLPDRVSAGATVGGMAPLDRAGGVRSLGMQADRILFPLARRAPLVARLLLRLSALQSPRDLQRSMLRSVTSPADREIIESMAPEALTAPFFEALRCGARGTIRDYRLLGGDWSLDLGSIRTPMTVWQGAEDRFVPPQHARYLERHLPDANLQVVPDCGHFLLHRHAERVLSGLVDGGDRASRSQAADGPLVPAPAHRSDAQVDSGSPPGRSA